MLAGSLIVPQIKSTFTTWVALLGLLTIHICMNYLAVRSVTMRTLNRQRANIVFSNYLDHLSKNESIPEGSSSIKTTIRSSEKRVILGPEEASHLERIF